jgi:hypothetical protein
VAELQSLQARVKESAPKAATQAAPQDRSQVEIELIQSLKEMLSRTFRPGKLATVLERKLSLVSKRFARIFFESELHEKLRGSANEQKKTMRFSEQALYHVLARNEERLQAELAALTCANDEVKERAREKFEDFVKDLRNGFLSRTTPELNQLVKYLNEVLTTFFIAELPPMVGELAWEVVKEARLADLRTQGAGYKIPQSAFATFRKVFERRFLQRLVPFVCDGMLRHVRDGASSFRNETIQLVADPAIFTDVCEVFSETIYDMLYNDGFLDLPADWRVRLSAEG